MIKSRNLLAPLFIASVALASCGGGGEGVTEQAGDTAATATDAATELTVEASDAVADAATDAADTVGDAADTVSDAVDPAAWQDMEMNWDSQVSSVQEAFPDLSVDEITGTAGKPDNLISLVEQKYGISKEEAQARVTEWASSL